MEVSSGKKKYRDDQDDEFIHLMIGIWQMSKEVKEEIFVITTQGMIGSVGGSLGMFFGFSFSAFVLYLIEKIIKRTSVQA